MNRLEQIKNDVAKEYSSFETWDKFLYEFVGTSRIPPAIDEVCKRYATECSEESLKKASENAKWLSQISMN